MLRALIILLLGTFAAVANPPDGYYANAEGKAGSELKDALHAIIRNHHVIPYSSSSFDTSDALKVLDQTATNASYVNLIYNNSNVLASTFAAATGWNREHMWAQSYGLDGVEPSYSDLFNLRACDENVNSSRGNKFYDITTTNGVGYSFPAHIEAPQCSTDKDSWQPPGYNCGNIARAMFYMVTRYTGDVANEPLLQLTDNPALITTANAYFGKLSTLLEWHNANPVDAEEMLRNDRIYSLYQTNRNPFVDHPEWVNLMFAPAFTNRPSLSVSLAGGDIVLSWIATNQVAQLETSTNLSGVWSVVTNVPALADGRFQVSVSHGDPRAFFRLQVQ
ncbi:MAG: endonuclease [Verrucomicrobiota bacterium]